MDEDDVCVCALQPCRMLDLVAIVQGVNMTESTESERLAPDCIYILWIHFVWCSIPIKNLTRFAAGLSSDH